MGENRSILTVLGSILGLVILIFVIRQAVGYYQKGASEFQEMQRQAGAPVLLSETLHNSDEMSLTTELTATTAAVTSAVTTTAEMTSTAGMTATEGVTATEGITATEGVTATTPVTTSAAVTTTSASTTTSALTATVPTTTSSALTTTAPVTTTEAVAPSAAVTTAASITETAAVTEAAAAEPTATEPEASAAEAATLTAPTPEEVAPIFTKAGCIGCHVIPNIPGAMGAVGPNLSEIGAVAATRVEGLSAVEYLHQSILEPNAFIAPECPSGPCLPGLMLQNLGDILTPEEIDMVVAYLATLGVEK